MAEVCGDTVLNIGKTKCTKVPQLPAAMIETPNGFVISEANLATAALLKAALQDAIKDAVDVRIYKWPKFSRTEDKTEETKYVVAPNGTRKARDGRYGKLHFVDAALCVHKAMFSHSSNEGRVIYVDIEGGFLLTKDSDGNYRGLSKDMLNVEKLKISNGDDLTETPIYVSLANNREIDENGYLFRYPGVYEELEPLTDVLISIVVTSATVLTVTVTNACDGTAVSGLVQADFSIKTTAGAAQVPTAFAESTDGVYTITKGTNFIDGNLNLVTPDLLTIDAYENPDGAITFDIP